MKMNTRELEEQNFVAKEAFQFELFFF